MSKFTSFLKSPVGRLHSAFAFFILLNVLSGLVNLYIRLPFTYLLISIHFYSGLLIIIAPLIVLATMKNRKIVLRAFFKIIRFNRVDFQKRRLAVIGFKMMALVIAVLTLINALTGILIKLVPSLTLLCYNIHVFDFKLLLAAVPLHILFALYKQRKPAVKPVIKQDVPRV